MEVERREKIEGLVTRGGETESDVGVGVTLEVKLHRYKKKGGREVGNDRRVGKARRRIRI